MALAFDTVEGFHGNTKFSVGNLDCKFVDVTLDTDYPDAGWAVDADDLGFHHVFAVIPCGVAKSADSETGVPVVYDHVNGTLVALTTGAASGAVLAEAADGLDGLANLVVRLMVLGHSK